MNDIITNQPNILKGVIIGKKSWGLWLQEYSDGVIEGSFTKKEILNEFIIRDIKIPDPFLLDFNNTIIRKFKKKY